ncbi:MAG: hypothetical protein ACHQFW_03505 [Chitinophagales bacterium]
MRPQFFYSCLLVLNFISFDASGQNFIVLDKISKERSDTLRLNHIATVYADSIYYSGYINQINNRFITIYTFDSMSKKDILPHKVNGEYDIAISDIERIFYSEKKLYSPDDYALFTREKFWITEPQRYLTYLSIGAFLTTAALLYTETKGNSAEVFFQINYYSLITAFVYALFVNIVVVNHFILDMKKYKIGKYWEIRYP